MTLPEHIDICELNGTLKKSFANYIFQQYQSPRSNFSSLVIASPPSSHRFAFFAHEPHDFDEFSQEDLTILVNIATGKYMDKTLTERECVTRT